MAVGAFAGTSAVLLPCWLMGIMDEINKLRRGRKQEDDEETILGKIARAAAMSGTSYTFGRLQRIRELQKRTQPCPRCEGGVAYLAPRCDSCGANLRWR